MSIHVHLQQFEGPLGLLLYLIRKDEMDIFNININQITQQYLEYIRKMREFDLEVAGDFVQMAATLIQIKSQMLLPQYNDSGEEIPQDDPRRELVSRLLEYQAYQEAAKKLNERPLLGRDLWTRGERQIIVSDSEPEIILDEGGLFSLIATYRKAIKKMKTAVHRVSNSTLSIAARILQIKEFLNVGERIEMETLMTEKEYTPRRFQTLITFLSVLELAKLGFVSLFQAEDRSDIHITTIQPVDRNVVERVQEYDAFDADTVAQAIMDKAEALAENDSEDLSENDFDDTTVDGALAVEASGSSLLSPEMAQHMADEMAIELANSMATDEDIAEAEAEFTRRNDHKLVEA